MSARRLAARSLGVFVLTAPIVASLLAVAVPAALAASPFTSPASDGYVFDSGPSFDVSADVPTCAYTAVSCTKATLTVTAPDNTKREAEFTPSRGHGGSVSLTTQTGPTSGLRNGRWTATVEGGSNGTRTFYTNYAPSTPSGDFSAQGSGARDVSFTWTKGSEADLTGYALYDGSGALIDGDIGLGHCSGGSCSYGLHYPSDNGGTHDYQLASKRASGGCSSCGSSLESPSKASASATLVNSPGSATSGPSTAVGGGGGTRPAGKSGPKGTTANAFAFSPGLGIPKLTPLPAQASLTGKGQLPGDTFKPTLPYKAKTTTEKTMSVLGQPIAAVRDLLDSAQLAKSIAAAFILLMVGAHLRRFLGVRIEQ